MEYLTELFKTSSKRYYCCLELKLKQIFIWDNYCSDFRKKRNIHARCGFFIQSIFGKILYPVEDIDTLKWNVKRYFTSDCFFCKVLGVWKLSIWPCSGLIYVRFEHFIHNVESVTQIIYAWRLPHNKIFPNWIKAIANRSY